jgi:hypothetical protein
MTLEQIEGNEPMHENWGTELGAEIDEVYINTFLSIQCSSLIRSCKVLI